MKTCPYCKNRIKDDAVYCHHCQRDVPARMVDNLDRPPHRLPQILVGAGALLMITGTLLPWGQLMGDFETVKFIGYQSDGINILVLGVLVAICAIFTRAQPGKPSYWPAIFLGLIGFFMIVMVFARVIGYLSVEQTGSSPNTINNGVGIYLSLIGNILAAVGGFIKA